MRSQINKIATPIRKKWIENTFKFFATRKVYPCVAARAALAHGLSKTLVVSNLGSPEDDEKILESLYAYVNACRQDPTKLASFIVIFEGPKNTSEEDFEQLLWNRVQCLHLRDAQRFPWTAGTSADVSSPEFSLSLGGEAFFIIGMHPNSSRAARRFRYPTLVFNLHSQFERLRATGKFEHMRDQTRERDVKYSGSINPMVEDFGKVSEAIQYSGRQVARTHRCPFAAFFKRSEQTA